MAKSKCRWECPEQWSEWSEWLAAGLHARNRWRLSVLLTGMLLANGRRTVTTWLRAAGVSDDYQDYYYFLSSVGRNSKSIATQLVTLLLRTLPLPERVLLVIDDSPTKRYGPKVEGADVHHNPTPGPTGPPFLYGHVWVTISLALRHPEWGPLALPLRAALYVRQQTMATIPKSRHWKRFATKLQLAAWLVEWIVPLLKKAGKIIWIVIDGGYTKRPFLRRVLKLSGVVFELARSAVHEYYITVSEDTLLTQPGMQSLREDLLRQALVYYQSFLDQRQDDPSLRKEVAEAHFFAGKITQTISSPADALTHFQKSVELQSQLLEAEPEEKELMIAHGQTLNAIGAAHLRLGDFQKSLEGFEQAAQVREQIAQADSTDVEAARTLANSVMNIGSVYLAQGNLEQAIPALERAQMIRMARVDQLDTADPKLRRDLGMGYYNLARLRLSLGDTALAENSFLTAVRAFESLLESAPDDMNYPRYLAACQRMLADLNAGEQHEKAIAFYRQAQETLEHLYRRNPDVLDYAADLAGVYLNLGQQLQLQGQTEEALDSMEKSAEVLQELALHVQSVPRYRLDLGIALRETGKILATLEQLDKARVHLENSRVILSRLVSENPANEHFTQQLALTMDALAGLEEPIPAE